MTKVTIGSIFSFMYEAYSVGSINKKLKVLGINDLEKVDKQTVRFEKFAQAFAKNPLLKSMVEKNPENENHILLLTMARYMLNFNQGKFDKAFEESEKAFKQTQNEGLKQLYLVTMLDSLNVMKSNIVSQTDKEVYQHKYEAKALEYVKLIENDIEKQSLENLKLTHLDKNKEAIKINMEYNGSYMSLAYFYFLNQDLKTSYECMNKLINKYGVEKVKEKESGQNAGGWFYRHQNDDYKYLVSSACEKYEAQKNKKQNLDEKLILAELKSFSENPEMTSQNKAMILAIQEKISLITFDDTNSMANFEIKDTCVKVLPNLMKVFNQTQNKESLNSEGKNAHDFLFDALSSVSHYLNEVNSQQENVQLNDMEAYSSFVQKKFKQTM